MLLFGAAGAVFLALDFPIAPVLLGYVLGPLAEENFRRALQISRGDLLTFVSRPISAAFISCCLILVVVQTILKLRELKRGRGVVASSSIEIGQGADH